MSFTKDDIVMSKYKLLSQPLSREKTLESIQYKLEVMRRSTRSLETEVSIGREIDKLSRSFDAYFSVCGAQSV